MARVSSKFTISFGYVLPSNNKTLYGQLEEKIMTINDLEYFFKILSPINSSEMIHTIRTLTKNSFYIFKMNESTDYGDMHKVIKVRRN